MRYQDPLDSKPLSQLIKHTNQRIPWFKLEASNYEENKPILQHYYSQASLPLLKSVNNQTLEQDSLMSTDVVFPQESIEVTNN